MLHNARFTFLTVIIIASTSALGQINYTYDYLPPSPTAAALGKYGLAPINLSTGVMTTSIPIYTLKTANLSIPISLSYAATGVKVDEIASNVGMNWSLNAGGVITRTVRDQDDMEEFSQPPYPKNTTTMNFELAKYLESATEEYFDSERDLYSFNFLNLTGKFVFTRENIPLVIPYRRLGIQRMRSPENTQFLVTDEYGIQYHFNAHETTRTIQQGLDCGKGYLDPVETAWYITKVIHPEGDTVYFDYESYHYTYSTHVSQTFTEMVSDIVNCPNQTCPTFNEKICKNLLSTTTVRLTKIRTSGYGDAVFHSSTRSDIPGEYKLDSIEFVLPANETMNKWILEYTFSNNPGFGNSKVTGSDLNHRMFLTTVYQKGNSGSDRKSYSFDYHDINGMPKRLSFAQDHWGYFNGKSNADLVPASGMVTHRDNSNRPLFQNIGGNREPDSWFASKGLLTKITYPTGGYDSITYEGNSYFGNKIIYPLKRYYDSSAVNYSKTTVEELTFTIHSSVSQDVQLNFSVSYLPGAEDDPIHCFGRISVRGPGNHYLIENRRVNPGDPVLQELFKLGEGDDYTVTIRAFGEGVKSNVYFDLYEEEPQVVQTNIPTGGTRVSRISSHQEEGDQSRVVRYYYASFNDLNRSSGIVSVTDPIYYQFIMSRHPCDGNLCDHGYECSYITLGSKSVNLLNGLAGNHITYTTVVIAQGDEFENGYEEHTFVASLDIPGKIIIGEHIQGAPYSNFAWDNGLEKTVKKFRREDASFRKIYELENTYARDTTIDHLVRSMVVRKKFDFSCTSEVIFICDAASVQASTSYETCLTNHDHQWLSGGIPFIDQGQTRCVAPGAQHGTYLVRVHPCKDYAVGDTVIWQSMLENLDVMEYTDFAHWFYLVSAKETVITDEGREITTVKDFRHNDKIHLQLTHESWITSTGEVLTTKYWYPHDFNIGSFVDSLKSRNILAKPIKAEHYRGSKTIGGTITKYNYDGSMAEVWRRNDPNPTDSVSHNPAALITASYQLEGSVKRDLDINKPREIHYPDGKIATLIWGYGKKYLAAQVMNKSFDEVRAILGNDFTTLEHSVNDSYINEKLEMLRDSLTESQIISYNYKPGVGVTSQTDANNVTTYYTYDSLGRVVTIKDDHGNVIKRFEYHYKTSHP